MTTFAQTVSVDGHLGRDPAGLDNKPSFPGTLTARAKGGNSMSIASSAQVAGPTMFEGPQPPVDSRGEAGLAGAIHPIEASHESEKGILHLAHYLDGAFILFGLVLFLLLPKFAEETVRAGHIRRVGWTWRPGVFRSAHRGHYCVCNGGGSSGGRLFAEVVVRDAHGRRDSGWRHRGAVDPGPATGLWQFFALRVEWLPCAS